ncbi:unnamed protein product [Hydatigera taeniaeformis]|uniref:Homeobox domain-containing protein n=1 Tax=Hydatigena taeniaeformis TaxID=6205 RepID=A0A0R3WUX1_HYDTA|nr:unnamed protein product [Hydatigera taeniaeformis]
MCASNVGNARETQRQIEARKSVKPFQVKIWFQNHRYKCKRAFKEKEDGLVNLPQSSVNSVSHENKEDDILSGRSSPTDVNNSKGDIQATSEMLQSLSEEGRFPLASEPKERFSAFDLAIPPPDTKFIPGSAPPYSGYGGQTMFLSSPRDPPRECENGCSDICRSYFNHCISDCDSSKRLATSIFGGTTNPEALTSTTDYPSHSTNPKPAFECYQRTTAEEAAVPSKHAFGVEMRDNEYAVRNMDFY